MKSIHSLRTSLCAAALLGIFAAGCETDPNSSTGAPDIRPMAANQADAHPAIVYKTTVTSKSKNYHALAVMDSDGTDAATIYTASSTAHVIGSGPSWNPGGTKVAFILYSTDGSVSWSICSRDVSVSRGKATGSNTSTIVTPSTTIRSLSWSATSATDQIAYTTQESGTGVGKVQVVSASGGTPTVLYQTSGSALHYYNSVTWSSDDSKIAFIDRTASSGNDMIRIINASTGALTDSIDLGTTSGITWMEWSRSGANTLALTIDYGSGSQIYYVTPTSGSTPSTNNVSGSYPTWSPTSTAVATWLPGSNTIQKTAAGTTSTSNISTSTATSATGGFPNWKR